MQCYYLLGAQKKIQLYQLLKIRIANEKNELLNKNLSEIIQPIKKDFKSHKEAMDELASIYDRRNISRVLKCRGIIGFFRFLQGYYLQVITKIEKVARIGRNKLFTIQETEIIELFDEGTSHTEGKYQKILQSYDLEIGFYSSYTYDLTNSLNANLQYNASEVLDLKRFQQHDNFNYEYSTDEVIADFSEVFMWNYFASYEFYKLTSAQWVLPIICGYLEQKSNEDQEKVGEVEGERERSTTPQRSLNVPLHFCLSGPSFSDVNTRVRLLFLLYPNPLPPSFECFR